MRVARNGSKEGSSDHSDTCQTLPRVLPSKVIQTTIKHNYRNLTSIPVVPHCHQIKHLYLSHNHIASLEGIQNYPALISLNLSYNSLSNIAQLKMIQHPHNIDKLSLRMNRFEFGYEDYAVGLMPNLRKLQGNDLPDAAGKQKMMKMKEKVGRQFINFYNRTNLIIRQMTYHQDKQNININRPKSQEKYNTAKNYLIDQAFFNKLKDLYFYPTAESLRQKNITFLINLCFSYITLLTQTEVWSCERGERRQDYERQTRQAFDEVCSAILLKFSSRNDKTLRNYLQSIKNDGESIINAFGKLGKFQCHPSVKENHRQLEGDAVKVHSLANSPARYMSRLDNQQLVNHPMNRLANWKQPNYRTLIPLEQTKWHNFYPNSPADTSSLPLFEHLPIFIYCKEYLQVVTEVVLEQVSKILALEHIILNNNAIAKSEGPSEEIQLNLSSSAVSFGNKDHADDSLDQIQPLHMKTEKQTGFNMINLGDHPQPHCSNAILKQVAEQQNIQMNVDKYSIYQISLIFKAFRSLKMQVKRNKQ